MNIDSGNDGFPDLLNESFIFDFGNLCEYGLSSSDNLSRKPLSSDHLSQNVNYISMRDIAKSNNDGKSYGPSIFPTVAQITDDISQSEMISGLMNRLSGCSNQLDVHQAFKVPDLKLLAQHFHINHTFKSKSDLSSAIAEYLQGNVSTNILSNQNGSINSLKSTSRFSESHKCDKSIFDEPITKKKRGKKSLGEQNPLNYHLIIL